MVIYSWFTYQKWWFSIVMSVYQRVTWYTVTYEDGQFHLGRGHLANFLGSRYSVFAKTNRTPLEPPAQPENVNIAGMFVDCAWITGIPPTTLTWQGTIKEHPSTSADFRLLRLHCQVGLPQAKQVRDVASGLAFLMQTTPDWHAPVWLPRLMSHGISLLLTVTLLVRVYKSKVHITSERSIQKVASSWLPWEGCLEDVQTPTAFHELPFWGCHPQRLGLSTRRKWASNMCNHQKVELARKMEVSTIEVG